MKPAEQIRGRYRRDEQGRLILVLDGKRARVEVLADGGWHRLADGHKSDECIGEVSTILERDDSNRYRVAALRFDDNCMRCRQKGMLRKWGVSNIAIEKMVATENGTITFGGNFCETCFEALGAVVAPPQATAASPSV